MNQLGWSAYESGDKPCPVPTSMSKKVSKLRGKAVSHWVHLRNFPLILRTLVKDSEDPVLVWGLQLHEIVERLTAQEFLPYEIDVLEERIVRYLDMRSTLRADYPNYLPNPKPKHHFMR